jgi:hypothetical protein
VRTVTVNSLGRTPAMGFTVWRDGVKLDETGYAQNLNFATYSAFGWLNASPFASPPDNDGSASLGPWFRWSSSISYQFAAAPAERGLQGFAVINDPAPGGNVMRSVGPTGMNVSAASTDGAYVFYHLMEPRVAFPTGAYAAPADSVGAFVIDGVKHPIDGVTYFPGGFEPVLAAAVFLDNVPLLAEDLEEL